MGCLHSKTTHLPSPDDPSSQLDPGLPSLSLSLSLSLSHTHTHTHTHTLELYMVFIFVLGFEANEIKLPLFFFWLFGYLGFEANGLQAGFLLSHSFDGAEFLWGFVCLFVFGF
jgi:hypothetical protein